LWSNAANGCAQSPASPLTGVLTSGGAVQAKAGSLAAAWTDEISGVSQLSLGSDPTNGPLIGVLISGAAFPFSLLASIAMRLPR
jgi:hypothetical protein